MVNKLFLIGRLGQKPDIKISKGGLQYCSLNLALNFKVKEGTNYVDKTDWVYVTVFDKVAENCWKYLDKGSQVYVEGRVKPGSKTDPDTNKKEYTLNIVADKVNFLSEPKAKEKNNSLHEKKSSEFEQDDIPF